MGATVKSSRLNLRVSAENADLLRQAAALQGQDLTSFIVGAALDKSREVQLMNHLVSLKPEVYESLSLQLENQSELPAKVLERWRRYQVAATDATKQEVGV